MKRLLLTYLLPALLFYACANEPSAGDERPIAGQPAATTANEAPVAQPANNDSGDGAAPAPAEARAAREEKPAIGTRPANQPPQSGQVLALLAQDRTAKAGSTACMDVKVVDFDNLLAMQYTMAWDAKLLAFKDFRNFGLPGLNAQNFGAHRTAEGLLTFVWIDGSLKGVTIPDNSTIFSVCFDVKGQPGQSAFFRFTDTPTAFEAVNVSEELVEIKPVEGKLIIQ